MTADSTVTTATAPGAEYADTASAAYRSILQIIESVEPRIAAATRKELADQRDSLKLIASENYASPAALLTMGSWLSDKYAEGTIGHRFYAGCQNVDTVDTRVRLHVGVGRAEQLARVLGGHGLDGVDVLAAGVEPVPDGALRVLVGQPAAHGEQRRR